MRSCDTCKAVLEDGAAYCARCGRPVPLQVAQDTPQTVRKLLTEANLRRIRGDYDAAIDNCTEALRLQPADPEVHSVLGDIYESAGNLEEAARWYQMAIELTPDSALDAAKLERTRARIRKRAKRSRPDTTTGSWSRSLLGQSRHTDPGIRKIVLVSAAVACSLLMFGVIAWVVRPHRARPLSRPLYQSPMVKPNNQSPPPGTSIPPISSSGTDEIVRPLAEQQFMSTLQTSPLVGDRHLGIEDVKLDPRKDELIITFRLPEPAIPLTRAEVIRSASAVAVAAFAADANCTAVCVRALAGIPSKSGVVEPHLVLICDSYRQITEIDPRKTSVEELARYFTNVWWGPELQQ